MINIGNQRSVTDAGVGARCARTGVLGAGMNVRVNASSLKDEAVKAQLLERASELERMANEKEAKLSAIVYEKIK